LNLFYFCNLENIQTFCHKAVAELVAESTKQRNAGTRRALNGKQKAARRKIEIINDMRRRFYDGRVTNLKFVEEVTRILTTPWDVDHTQVFNYINNGLNHTWSLLIHSLLCTLQDLYEAALPGNVFPLGHRVGRLFIDGHLREVDINPQQQQGAANLRHQRGALNPQQGVVNPRQPPPVVIAQHQPQHAAVITQQPPPVGIPLQQLQADEDVEMVRAARIARFENSFPPLPQMVEIVIDIMEDNGDDVDEREQQIPQLVQNFDEPAQEDPQPIQNIDERAQEHPQPIQNIDERAQEDPQLILAQAENNLHVAPAARRRGRPPRNQQPVLASGA